jgi:hypothetical protein
MTQFSSDDDTPTIVTKMSVNIIKIDFFVESATPNSIRQGKALPIMLVVS